MSGHEATEIRQSGAEDSRMQGAAIAILGADHEIISWTLPVELLTGYNAETLNAIGWARLFEPLATMHQVLEKAQAGVSTSTVRLRLRKRDGELLPVDVQCLPLRSCGDADARRAYALLEISPALEAHHAQAHSSSMGRLASFLSHEIRNPLNAISLHLDILAEECGQATPGEHTQISLSLDTIKAEISRLYGLMQDFLSLTRLSDIRCEPEDVGMFLQAVARDVQEQLAGRGLLLQVEGIEELGEASFHTPTLHRALLNLAQHAAAAMSQGDTLTLGGWKTPSHLHFAMHQPRGHLQTDTVPQDFGAAQMRAPDQRDFALYVAQAIVRAHGGTLEASSKPGHGTTLTITLPHA